MERIVYYADGNYQDIGYNGSTYILLGVEGLSAVEVLPSLHSGYQQNGSSIDYLHLGNRIITIRFAIKRDTMQLLYSSIRDIMARFSPLNTGKLTYQNDQNSYSLDNVFVSSPPTPINKYGTYQEFEVELTATNPIFRTTQISSYTLTKNNRKQLYYSGSAPTEYYIEIIHNSSSTITKPKIVHEKTIYLPSIEGSAGIQKTITSYIELDATYGDVGSGKYGHEIICTGYGKKGQESIITSSVATPLHFHDLGYNSIGDITSGSTFEQIGKEYNYFTLTTESGTPYKCNLYYYTRYIGV